MSVLAEEPKAVVYTKPAAPVETKRPRLDAIDIVRGIVMVIMALDHVKHFFCRPDFFNDPLDLSKEQGAALFLTRWVTHYCAPTFVFLAGTSAFLYGTRGKSNRQVSWFLFSRGLWLVLVDITLVNWSWAFRIDYSFGMGGGIIFLIGACLIIMSALIWLPTAAVAALGVSIIAFQNLLDAKTAEQVGLPYGLWSLLHGGSRFWILTLQKTPLSPDALKEFLQTASPTWMYALIPDAASKTGYKLLLSFECGYRLLSWLGMTAAGYGFGALFLLDRPERRRQLIGLGVVLTLLFIGLRWFNEYGDRRYPAPDFNPTQDVSNQPGPWTTYDKKEGGGTDWVQTTLSFLNTQKYPASLLFTLMTLGPAILLIGLFDRATTGPISRFFIAFGRVPFFFYLIHLPLIHALAVGFDYLWYKTSPMLTDGPWAVQGAVKEQPETFLNYGWSLPMTYLVWAVVVLILYPFCWWFARLKQRYRSAILSYL
jgi:uncharacterized membrane protein